MTLSPDSPELTAYLLGELDAETRAALEAELAISPELAAELNSLSQILGVVSHAFADEPAVGLSPDQQRRVMEAVPAMRAESCESTSERRAGSGTLWDTWIGWLGWRGGFVLAGGLAAAAAVGFFLVAPKPGVTQSLALAEALRYQPERKPAPPSTQGVAAPAVAVVPPVPLAPPASNEAIDRAVAPAPAPVADLAAPTLSKRYGLQLPLASQAAPAESKAKADAHWEFQATGGAERPLTRSLSGALSKEELGRSYFYKQVPPAGSGLGGSDGQGAGFRGADAMARFGLASDLPAPAPTAPGLRVVESKLVDANGPSTSFAPIQDNPFHTVTVAPLSTFGMDVDTGSYSLIRRMLRENSLPPGDAVRLEELLNYFSYDYPQPKGDYPLGATVEVAACPWNDGHKLVRIGVKAREMVDRERPRSNLVFLLDVSGSMAPETRLPLVKRAMRLLIDRLSPRDTVGIVTYAGEARVALEPVAISDEGRRQVTEVLDGLQAGSGTHGSAGIQNAYAMATNHFIAGGVNRVILCTDGDFNVGVTDQNVLLSLITARAKSGVFLSVLGFGMDNLKDATLELLADKGNGNYAYIDSFAEARKVLVKQLDGTLVTVAKDAKIQVEFNPARVSRYRLLGYEKRLLRNRDFNDDTKDAGEVGAGHSVTVLYEIEPVGGTGAGVDPLRYGTAAAATADTKSRGVHVDELLNLKIRYKQPDGQTSRLMELPVKDADREFAKASTDFKFAASVAGYGMLLRQSPYVGSLTWERVLRLAEQGQGNDPDGYRAEFIDLARRAQTLRGQP